MAQHQLTDKKQRLAELGLGLQNGEFDLDTNGGLDRGLKHRNWDENQARTREIGEKNEET